MNNQIMKKNTIYGITLLALTITGCVPRLPTPPVVQEQNTTHRAMWEDTSGAEEHYSLKPEPYSLESGQKDPELLGPQSTIKHALVNSETVEPGTSDTTEATGSEFVPREEPKSQNTVQVMTRSKCIELIGQAKYDLYTKQFGSETAALRKCTILQRLQH